MNNDYFVKIEDKTMPVCDFDYPNLDIEKKGIKNAGFVNFVYLLGIVVTAFMWIMLMFVRK